MSRSTRNEMQRSACRASRESTTIGLRDLERINVEVCRRRSHTRFGFDRVDCARLNAGCKNCVFGRCGEYGSTHRQRSNTRRPKRLHLDRIHIRDRDHVDEEGRASELERIIVETLDAGGNIVIPAFAVGRTQDILYEVHRLQREGRIPEFRSTRQPIGDICD